MYFRAFCVWLILVGVEIIHGTLRVIFLAPRVGDFLVRQIGGFIGSAIVLTIAYLFAGEIDAKITRGLIGAGALWLGLAIVFEIGAGRLVAGYSCRALQSVGWL